MSENDDRHGSAGAREVHLAAHPHGDVSERHGLRIRAGLELMPARHELVVQAFLAAEVVGDELRVHARALRDLADPRPGEALGGELGQRGVHDALAGTGRIPLALLRIRSPARARRGPVASHRDDLTRAVQQQPIINMK